MLGVGGQLPPLPFSMEAGVATIALYAELFLSLLSCKGAFSGVVDRFIMELFLGQAPDPQLTMV